MKKEAYEWFNMRMVLSHIMIRFLGPFCTLKSVFNNCVVVEKVYINCQLWYLVLRNVFQTLIKAFLSFLHVIPISCHLNKTFVRLKNYSKGGDIQIEFIFCPSWKTSFLRYEKACVFIDLWRIVRKCKHCKLL